MGRVTYYVALAFKKEEDGHLMSSGLVCGQLGGGLSGADAPAIGLRMMTNPEFLRLATSRSAVIFDMVSAACDRASALPEVRASANAISRSCKSAGVRVSSSGMVTG
jgi:hypothetical protein